MYDVTAFPRASGIKYYHIPLIDDASEDILSVFKEYVPKIDEIIKTGGRVLIHCALGVSRSAALCVAYLMHRLSKSPNNAISNIHRPIEPNKGFRKALDLYADYLKINYLLCEDGMLL